LSVTDITRLYSPDLSPTDLRLVDYITATPEGFFFQDINEARNRIVAISGINSSRDLYPGI
jgi:hypothetical protein